MMRLCGSLSPSWRCCADCGWSWPPVLDDLPAMMGLVQESVTQASDAIGARYFMSGPVQEWTGEIL